MQQRKPECPLCRSEFSATASLQVNRDLEALLQLAANQHDARETAEWEVRDDHESAHLKEKQMYST